MSPGPIRVTVWGEGVEQSRPDVGCVYPDGIHEAVAAVLRDQLGSGAEVRTAGLGDSEHGLEGNVLEETDVLVWWGHSAHEEVADAVVERAAQQVLDGMGLVVLHSGHGSKLFRRLMGTRCTLRWRNASEREIVWVVAPTHPIADGLSEAIVVPKDEMYGEYFDIPAPEELVFISSFAGGEVFRSGCCWTRGKGRVFYFSPGHETQPVYYQPEIGRVLGNGVRWARRRSSPIDTTLGPNSPAGWLEESAPEA